MSPVAALPRLVSPKVRDCPPGSTPEVTTSPDGKPYQYRAVCLESSKHPDAVFVLSKWADDRATVWDLGNYHGSHKAKGHRWVIQRRVHR